MATRDAVGAKAGARQGVTKPRVDARASRGARGTIPFECRRSASKAIVSCRALEARAPKQRERRTHHSGPASGNQFSQQFQPGFATFSSGWPAASSLWRLASGPRRAQSWVGGLAACIRTGGGPSLFCLCFGDSFVHLIPNLCLVRCQPRVGHNIVDGWPLVRCLRAEQHPSVNPPPQGPSLPTHHTRDHNYSHPVPTPIAGTRAHTDLGQEQLQQVLEARCRVRR